MTGNVLSRGETIHNQGITSLRGCKCYYVRVTRASVVPLATCMLIPFKIKLSILSYQLRITKFFGVKPKMVSFVSRAKYLCFLFACPIQLITYFIKIIRKFNSKMLNCKKFVTCVCHFRK